MRNAFKKLTGTIFLLAITLLTIVTTSVRTEAKDTEVNKIPIAMATDNNYIYPTIIAMTSMLENKKESTNLDFYIMISGQVSEENRNRLNELTNIYKGCSVQLINLRDKFSTAYAGAGNFQGAAYYRLILPSLLSEYDKILYLDGDIIVRKDLWDMYSMDLQDNYIAAVKDMAHQIWGGQDYAYKLGVRDTKQYINSGILIMNLKKMREDNMERKFSDLIPQLESRGLVYPDQDILNSTCYDKIKFMSPEYNTMQGLVFIDNTQGIYDSQEWKRARTDPTIIHYSSGDKPWKGRVCNFYDEWDKYRKISEEKVYGTPVIEDGIYTISSSLNRNKVLDIECASHEDKANLQLWAKNDTDAQKFKITYVGEGYYEIEACCSRKLLDVAGAENRSGANVWQYQKNNSDAQKWIIKKANNGYCYVISKCNGLCLDVSGAKVRNGTNIQVWSFNGTRAQKFKFLN